MQLRKTDERQVYGVEGRGRGKGQNETKQTKLKTVTKIKSALEKYALMNGKWKVRVSTKKPTESMWISLLPRAYNTTAKKHTGTAW